MKTILGRYIVLQISSSADVVQYVVLVTTCPENCELRLEILVKCFFYVASWYFSQIPRTPVTHSYFERVVEYLARNIIFVYQISCIT